MLEVHLRALATRVPIVARTTAALWGRLQRPAIDLPHQHAQATHHVFKHARLQPALRWLVHRVPVREGVGHHAPLQAGAYDVAQRDNEMTLSVSPPRLFSAFA